MSPADFLRDYLSKWGPEMDPDEYAGMQRCVEALDAAAAAVAADIPARGKVAAK